MAFVEVIQPDGSSVVTEIGDQAKLGRSPDVLLSFPALDFLDEEHVMFAPRGKEGCWVAVSKTAAEPVFHKKARFVSGVLPWNSTIRLGALSVRLLAKRQQKKDSGVGPVGIIAGLLAVAAGVYFYFQNQKVEAPPRRGAQAPALFDKKAVACPSKDASAARRLQNEADSRADRYRYDASEGPKSVKLFREATACLKSQASADAPLSLQAAETLQKQIEGDYVAARLRLTRALRNEDMDDAQREVDLLLSLTSHVAQDDAYVTWLKKVRRHVVARLLEKTKQ